MSRYQKGKTNLDFSEARDSKWQWHQLGRMQVCTSLQADNHASTPPLSFLQAGCPSCRPTNSVKAPRARALKVPVQQRPQTPLLSLRLATRRSSCFVCDDYVVPRCAACVSNTCIAVRKVATPLRELTCHMGSDSVTCHPAEVTFPPSPQPKLVLD